MKRLIRIVLPIVLAIAILLCTAWYLFIYDQEFTRDMLLYGARYFESRGDHSISAWFYDRAYDQAADNDEVAIELAEQYVKLGNFTRAEYTLYKAIEDGGTTDLYIALCKTFVAQDKLLDAVKLLDNIRNSEIIEELNKLRPAAPVASPAPGFYSQYISVSIECEEGKLYAHPGGQYPSLETDSYNEPLKLSEGENSIYAVAVNDDGLVSPLSILGYTVGGVIEEVKFADESIEASVRSILNEPDKTLYSDDLWKITEFTVPENATSFADLSYMQFVTKLIISGGPTGQLSNLSQMTSLTELSISNVSVQNEELPIIGNLPMLESLTLTNCGLSTTTGLENAKKLTYLDISNNTVRNITALASMRDLTQVYLQHNAVTDLSALNALTSISKLDVSYNAITSLSPICGSGGINWLNADNNQLGDLAQIGNLINLNFFSCANNSLTDISAISGCVALEELNLSGNKISDASALSALTSVTMLNLAQNNLTGLPAFASDCSLVTIDASHNQITSLEPLSGLKRLNNVHMDYNESLSSIAPLTKCPVLILVNVYGTKVTNVKDLTSQSIIVNYDPT